MVPAVSLTMTFPKHVIERRRTTVEEPDTMSSRAVAKNADNEICGTVPLGMGSVLNEDGVSALLQQQKSKTSRPESSLRPTRRPVPGSAIGSHGMVTEVEDENFNDNVIGGCDGHGLWLGRRLHRCGSARAQCITRTGIDSSSEAVNAASNNVVAFQQWAAAPSRGAKLMMIVKKVIVMDPFYRGGVGDK